MKKFLAKLFGITTADLAVNGVEPESTQVESSDKVNETGEIEVHGKINDNGQIELKIDWNDEFIKELKANGYNGANDEVIIQMYLATIHRRLMEDEKNGQYQ